MMPGEQQNSLPSLGEDVRARNYLKTEVAVAMARWFLVAFSVLYLNLLRPAGWPLGLFNALLGTVAAYNFAITLYTRRARSFSPLLTRLVMYLDTSVVAAGLFYTGGDRSPFLFIWYLSLFAAGVRFGFLRSLFLQVPVAAYLTLLVFRFEPAEGPELVNRLVLGLFSISAVAMYGSLFQREERETLRVVDGVHQASITDRLTGLYNYSYFVDELQKEHARALRNGSHFSLLLFDLDFFKQVNDTYGHEKGNVLLREVAGIIKANARRMDTVARYGGEEFVVLMPNSSGAEVEMGERIRTKVEATEFSGIADGPIRITISAGACTFPQDATSVYELLDKADKGLYLAKNTGRNRTCYCKQL